MADLEQGEEALYSLLHDAHAILDELLSPTPSRPVTPGTLDRNRMLIDDLTRKMLDRGQLKPLSTQEQIDSLASTVAELPTPTASQTMELNIVAPVSEMMGKLKRVVRHNQAADDIDDFYDDVSHALDEIDTPTPSQPRDPEILQRGQKQLEELTAKFQRKQMVPPPKKRKAPTKVCRLLCMYAIANPIFQRFKPVPVVPTQPSRATSAAATETPSAVDPEAVQKIVDMLGNTDPLEVEDVLDLFQRPEDLRMADAEHKALTRAFGGVRWEKPETWVRPFVLRCITTANRSI